MNIGVIGTGDIGAVIVKKLRDAGYPVKMASSKGPDSLRELAAKTGAIPVSVPNVSAKALKWKDPTLRSATEGLVFFFNQLNYRDSRSRSCQISGKH